MVHWPLTRRLVHAPLREPSTSSSRTLSATHCTPSLPMAKRGPLDVTCPAAKRVVVDGVGGGSSRTAENRTVAQELLRGVLAGLLVHKTAADFPLKCVATVLSEVAPLLDGPYNSNDTLLLRAETGAGRNLGLVLLLAAATVAGGGLAALKAERAELDDSRRGLADDADSQLDRLGEACAQNKPASGRSLCCPLVFCSCNALPGDGRCQRA